MNILKIKINILKKNNFSALYYICIFKNSLFLFAYKIIKWLLQKINFEISNKIYIFKNSLLLFAYKSMKPFLKSLILKSLIKS